MVDEQKVAGQGQGTSDTGERSPEAGPPGQVHQASPKDELRRLAATLRRNLGRHPYWLLGTCAGAGLLMSRRPTGELFGAVLRRAFRAGAAAALTAYVRSRRR